MAAETLRVAVVGLGFGARVQLPVLTAHPGTAVVSVCSRTMEHARAAATQVAIPHYTDDYRKSVSRADIDLVSIVAPPRMHAPVTLAALRARKHVLCEKPFAM